MTKLYPVTQNSGDVQDLGVVGETDRGLKPRFTKIGGLEPGKLAKTLGSV